MGDANGGSEGERDEQRVEENRSTSEMCLYAQFRQGGRELPELGVAMESTLLGMTPEHRSVPMQVDS